PTTGLDPKTKHMVWQSIESLRQDLNMTIFLTTHYMEEAATAQHIGVIHQGQMIADTCPSLLKEQYACDQLRLHVKDMPAAIELIKPYGLKYQITAQALIVFLPHTRAALNLLDVLKEHIITFEVIQGSMEDAFLNLMNTTIEGGTNHANYLDTNQAQYQALHA
ncbi:MAG: hypothetical protein ACRCTE_03600, partial [Cellulosilyticaceae bacterium]